jgi:hypothetical protein
VSVLSNISLRPVRPEDLAQLDVWRRKYPDAFLELPKGVSAEGVETAVAEKNFRMIGSLTGTLAVLMDPFIHDVNATGPDVFAAVYMLERALAYKAQSNGAVDAYIAVPDKSTAYHSIVERAGYQKTCEHCTIFRRPLRPDTVTLIEHGG